ncbi:MAG: hypothetical protein HZB14_05975 [Actinobacteria bacterium]|nr:hypothetical protein [Actinomycetota bacterium]
MQNPIPSDLAPLELASRGFTRRDLALLDLSRRIGAIAIDRAHRLRQDERGQATVEYVGLVVVLGTGIGMIVAGLDTLGFVSKVGAKLIKGITGALDKIMPG